MCTWLKTILWIRSLGLPHEVQSHRHQNLCNGRILSTRHLSQVSNQLMTKSKDWSKDFSYFLNSQFQPSLSYKWQLDVRLSFWASVSIKPELTNLMESLTISFLPKQIAGLCVRVKLLSPGLLLWILAWSRQDQPLGVGAVPRKIKLYKEIPRLGVMHYDFRFSLTV